MVRVINGPCSPPMHHLDFYLSYRMLFQRIKKTHTKYTIHLKLVLATDYYKDLYVWYNNNLKMFMYKMPRWWSTRIETCRQTCKVTYNNKIKCVHLLAIKFTSITKMHGATHIKVIFKVTGFTFKNLNTYFSSLYLLRSVYVVTKRISFEISETI
jgi:hypothetical protein